MKVFVYFNLHKKKWSIRAMEGEFKGKVIAHKDYVFLYDAHPKVSEAGRQRVLKEQCKNVHAGVIGEWLDSKEDRPSVWSIREKVYYNPYETDCFIYKASGSEWKQGDCVEMFADTKQVYSYEVIL